MRVLLSILLLPFAIAAAFGQNDLQEKKPAGKDSVTLSKYRLKVTQTINAYPDSALVYIKKFEDFSTKGKFANSLADADYLYAQYFRRIQKPDSALVYFNKMIAKSTKTNYYRGLALGYNGLCRTYYLIGEIDKAIEACNKGLEYTKDFEDTGNIVLADTQNALAIAYSRQNKMEKAISHLLVVDSIQKKEPLREDVIAAAYQSLGNIYLELKEYNSAEAYYLKANKEFEKIPGAGTFYFNTTNVFLGQVYYHKGQLEKADNLLTNTLVFFQQIKDERTIAEINNYLGLVNFEKGNLEKAEMYFQNSLDFQKKNDYNLEAAESAIQLGKLNIQRGKASQAINFLQSALDHNLEIKNGTINQKAHSLLAEAYALQGNYKAAFTNSQIATKIKDSIQQAQSAEKIKEIEGIYQTESRDREISLLTTKNELVEQQKKNQRNLLWGIVTIIAIAGVFIFFQFRNRQKTTKKLRELDTAKSTFFANISHEFRTPLTLINGPIEDHLVSDKLSQTERKNFKSALRNTQRLKDLVDQLLALARLESGNLKLNIQQANLPKFIIAQAEAFSFSCDEKNITFTIELEKDEIEDWFDQDVLENIIYNLMGNAIKYSPENGIIKLIGKRQREKYKISVINSGNYIALDQQQKIFTRFYQTDTKNPGTGIGLALTKDLTEIHKGTISVKSEQNGITEFTVILSVNKNAFEENQIFYESPEKESMATLPFVEKFIEKEIILPEDAPVILVIDDNMDIRDYVSSIFENTSTVHKACNGKEGFVIALKEIPDIVISDVMMPEEDGFTFTKHLKENQLTSHIPVILLTAKTQVTSKLEAMGIGADAYITKPFNSQLLKAIVENLIENRRKLQQRFAQEVVLMPKDISVSSADESFLERLQKVLDENITDSEFSIENFGCEMGVSRMQLHRKLKALTGQSTSEFLRTQRLKIAARILREKKIPISEVGYTVGFNDPSYFTKCFKQEFGSSPSEYISK
ncbi:tetratricopeptide repeat protein [Aequorivita lipolytica]|uniref:histidine kinase n=1 Tax=Aequorivita lipolytica TaxID=153267 RepID=A0A5C6YRH1_9FLAO|nr:tetratricopeptide repeat protein [Aequorivita lipolytica]TXD69969.1 tetratricopeptide repeat protein [Aequorivita lipolytica]SRX50206.1 Sensor histidine kinase TmoS [Aequorivita lipolytica]